MLLKARVSQTIYSQRQRKADIKATTTTTCLVVDLWDLDRMARRAGSIDNGKGGRPGRRVSNVVHVVRSVEVLPVPAAWGSSALSTYIDVGLRDNVHGKDNTAADASGAWSCWKALGVKLGIHAGAHGVALEVGTCTR